MSQEFSEQCTGSHWRTPFFFFFLILTSILSKLSSSIPSLHPYIAGKLLYLTEKITHKLNIHYPTKLFVVPPVCVVVSWNFLPPIEDLTGCCWAHFHLMTGMKKSSERDSSILSFVSLYAHTPKTLTPCLIRVLKEQGRTHHPVNAPSLLSPVSDNFQINSAIFHLTLSRPRAELSQTPKSRSCF